jgi:hypothetical protein
MFELVHYLELVIFSTGMYRFERRAERSRHRCRYLTRQLVWVTETSSCLVFTLWCRIDKNGPPISNYLRYCDVLDIIPVSWLHVSHRQRLLDSASSSSSSLCKQSLSSFYHYTVYLISYLFIWFRVSDYLPFSSVGRRVSTRAQRLSVISEMLKVLAFLAISLSC